MADLAEHMSVRELARRAGISPATAHRFKLGQTVDIPTAQKLLGAKVISICPCCDAGKSEAKTGWEFAEGDLVRKKSGSWWEGRIVGTYSTAQTPRGYAVQLDKPFGPVQIYPESALESALQSEER